MHLSCNSDLSITVNRLDQDLAILYFKQFVVLINDTHVHVHVHATNFILQRFYIPTSRQLKRIESTTRSPIYSHFSETISGVSTIRAYGFQQRFITESEEKVDHNLVFYFANVSSNRYGLFHCTLQQYLVIIFVA